MVDMNDISRLIFSKNKVEKRRSLELTLLC
jgi:hypothetical protein